MPEPTKTQASQTIGKYELIRPIGDGNMGTVFLARDPFSLQDVAVKIATPKPADEDRIARRRRKLFYIEAKAAGMLRHPNIVATIDAGIEDDRRYLVMEYVQGASTLDRYCAPDNLLPVERVVGILLKCALAFGFAHDKGVVHRDIKPKNIMLTQDNEVKICDFGLALITSADINDTQVMGRLGSPRYMSPEQVSEEMVTNQSDIFSLGIVAYEMLTGISPFKADNISAIAKRITREPHKPITEFRDDVPPALVHIIDRTLKKHPAGRYQSAMDLAGDLSLIHDEMRHTASKLSGTRQFERISRLSFFDEFEEAEILEAVNTAEWQEFDPGSEIIVEGEFDENFYLLVSGKVSVRRADVEVDVLEPGATFGELGFIVNQARTATIIADDKVIVLKIRASLIDRTSVNCQLRFQKAFLKNLAERFCSTMNFIARSRR
ncbi:MAG: protein kinase [Gammaproteobacteria bacterium]|jgi:serine/threonine protein kinase|nr:protein kinase [Gammaproteobacteria bacterium]NCF80581.1 protein kinase [Pseudomonadota bacterium]